MADQNQKTLGQRLRERREELNLSIRNVAAELATSQKFVCALEAGNYKELTAKVYARGFLDRAIILLGLDEHAAELIFCFEREWDLFIKRKTTAFSYKQPQGMSGEWRVTPARIRFGAIALGLFLLLSFLGIRIFGFLRAPALVINEPFAEEVRKSEPVMKVSGKGQKESRLTMNGRELRMGESGEFTDTIELLPGLNTLEFVLENRFGKLTRVMKYVLVE
ncbi:MAG: helix-turn-helix domain-containing protein [Candidatus Sungbacteria bacterium]|nr:helix-turn-helix domain-containing protein [Candidatus Sungbacteria bacterium]